MKYLVGLLLIVVSADQNLDSYIFNGQDAEEGDFPYQVGLYKRIHEYNDYRCGGSLISETFIVTAAHCIDNYDPEYITALLGSRQLRQGTERRARNKIVHPGWDGDENDIGLLEIDFISYSDTIRNIDLPPFSDLNLSYEAHIAVASGWGHTDTTWTNPLILQYAHFVVISNTACDKAYGEGSISEDVICAADPAGSAGCIGDSGGPLVDVDSNNLIGIVSFGPSAVCINNFGTGFTRVTSYRQWIYDNTGI